MIKEIIEKYKLSPNSYYPDNKVSTSDAEIERELTLFLQRKWEKFIPKGWYGFMGLGSPTPLNWFYALDDFFKYVSEKEKNLQILQVKIKFGKLVIYLNNISSETEKEVEELCSVLKDKNLIY